jgi:hypothetical protein
MFGIVDVCFFVIISLCDSFLPSRTISNQLVHSDRSSTSGFANVSPAILLYDLT